MTIELTHNQDSECDYCHQLMQRLTFYLIAVGFDNNRNVIVKTHCGLCDAPNDVNDEAQEKLFELMK